jgi:hypothetical protein
MISFWISVVPLKIGGTDSRSRQGDPPALNRRQALGLSLCVARPDWA